MRRRIHRIGSPLRACWWAATLWWLLMSGERPKPLGESWQDVGSVQMGSHLALAPPPFFFFFEQINCLHTMGQISNNFWIRNDSKWGWEVYGTSKIAVIARHLREIHHWHLDTVWWPKMERLEFRCLKLNCTAGMQQTWQKKKKLNINGWASTGSEKKQQS